MTETAAPEPPRTLQFLGYRVFRGEVQTSTTSGRMMLPSDMSAWFNRRGYPLSEATKASMAGHLNRGWTVVAIELGDRSPNVGAFANTPVVSFRFPSESALFPLMRQPAALESEPIFDVWTLGTARLVPQNYATAWSTEPWAQPLVSGRFTAVYSREITATEPLVAILGQQFGLQLPPTPQLVRHQFQHGGEIWQEQAFVPAVQPIDIPGGGARGGALDIFLCVLLGVLPLVFAPESWLLLWLGGRSREREREGGSGWPNLWAYYAMGVALYWLVTLDGLARMAALLPLLIGVVQLAWPASPGHAEFVRVQFKEKAKASS